MPRKKVAEEELEELEEPEKEEELEELGGFNPEEVDKPSKDDLIKNDVERLKEVWKKLIEALTINQKYIKRNYDNIKTMEENFNILLGKLK